MISFKQLLVAITLSTSVTFPAVAETEVTPTTFESVISLPAGHFFENLTYLNKDELIATDYTGMSLYKYHLDGKAKLWAKVDGHPVSLRFGEGGNGLLSVHEISILEGDSFVNSMALFKINQDGQLERLIGLDTPAFLNGMAYLGNQKYLIADALNGKIYKFDMASNKLSVWLEDTMLQPEKDRPGLPGINGIQLHEGDLYFTNSAKQIVGKIDITEGRAGEITVLADDIQADDFTIDEKGTWLITTHHHEVIKYTQDGTKTVVLNHGIDGNTAIQPSTREDNVFYITNDGGLLFGGEENAGLHKIAL